MRTPNCGVFVDEYRSWPVVRRDSGVVPPGLVRVGQPEQDVEFVGPVTVRPAQFQRSGECRDGFLVTTLKVEQAAPAVEDESQAGAGLGAAQVVLGAVE